MPIIDIEELESTMVSTKHKDLRLFILIGVLTLTVLSCAATAASASVAHERAQASRYILENYPRVKQLPNYCGPATLATVLQYWGKKDETQERVGKAVYDPKIRATNGADMLMYARDKGFSSYSFNGSMTSLKRMLSQGLPIIVLQDMDRKDRSGHFRVVTGYDDRASIMHIFDPYEPERIQMTYIDFTNLWRGSGNWGMVVMPTDKDHIAVGLRERNPVVHLDLAQAYYRRGAYEDADRELRLALRLEPTSPSARDMLSRIQNRRGATGQGSD